MNFLESLIPTSLAESIGLTFMHALWQLAAVALLLLIVNQFVPRKSSRTRYLLGTGALVLMPLLAITTFFMVHQPAEAAEVAPNVSAMLSNGQILELEEHFAAREANLTFLSGVTTFFNENARLLFAIWVFGSLMFAMRFALGYFRVQRLRSRNTEPVPAEIQATLTRLQDIFGLRRTVQILQSTSIDTPMVIGALRPVVLLPVGLLTGLSPEQVECILAHELAHIRRRDYLVNIFQSMVEILFFFHPAVWWVSNMVREERENCCDEAVLALKNDNMVYARALLNLESLRTAQPGLAMASNGGSLFKRIRRITGAEARETRFYSRGLFVAMLTLTLILVVSSTASKEMKASSPMMTVNEIDPVGDPMQPQTPPSQKSSSTEAGKAKDSNPADVKGPLSGMEKMLSMVAEIPAQLSEGGNQLRSHIDNALFDAILSEMNARQDTPVTKLTLLEDGKEILMELDREGRVEKVTVDGKPAPKSDYDKYKRMASQTFRGYLGKNDPMPTAPTAPTVRSTPPMPSTPPMSNLNGMPPMPAVPSIGKVPAPPAPPAKGNMSDREFEKAMEGFEEAMEDWGERLEEKFESADWGRFEEEMEVWGESLEKNIESQDWERFGEEMEAWGEELASKIESQDWEKFGAEMERWGESLARSMERMDHAKAREDHVRHQAERMRSGVDRLAGELTSEGLIDEGDAYKLKINEDEFFVNGNRQADGIHRRFKRLIEDELGIEVGEEWVEINKKKGSVKIKNEN